MTPESELVHEGPAVRVGCEECEQPMPPRERAGGQPKRFCSGRCRNKFNARKRREVQLVHEDPAVRVGRIRKQRPLPEAANEAAWALRKDVERIERIFADARFGENKEKVAPLLRGHLSYTAQACHDLISRITPQQEG